jgi:hypothetical protein
MVGNVLGVVLSMEVHLERIENMQGWVDILMGLVVGASLTFGFLVGCQAIIYFRKRNR